jgi:pyruvate/2-oxoglutarate/acetoin dehydrogenase E1 component
MERTVADTIRELTRRHIAEANGVVMGQCLSAVGWVQNTVPAQVEGVVELPMTDIAGAGFAVGMALAGRRPIFVIRFQSFLWLNASPLVNYAAKSKAMFGYSCPVMVRAIAAEGGGTGPVHSHSFHSIFMHSPGMPVSAPMTPGEFEAVWHRFATHDDPLLVSEHRASYAISREMPDMVRDDAVITVFAIGPARLTAETAVARLAEAGVACNLIHVVWLKPFDRSPARLEPLRHSGLGLVVDATYETCGAARSIAYELMEETGRMVHALGLEDRSPGAHAHLENPTPSPERIMAKVSELLASARTPRNS